MTQKTREIADKAAAEGITPLEVMLRAMHSMVDEAERIEREQRDKGAEEIAVPFGLWQDAAAIAKDAAPYMHPRLAAIEHSGPNGGPIEGRTTLDVSGLSMEQLRALASIRIDGE